MEVVKDVLILVLTSKDITVLKECIKSCCTQNNTSLTAEVRIICNSTNSNYAKSLQSVWNENVIVTESNGRPGKGHNACIEYFYTVRSKYKYMIVVDGDDFLYPTALHEIEKLLKAKPETDVISIQANDKLVRLPEGTQEGGYLRDNIYLKSFLSKQENLWETNKDVLFNPFDNISDNLRTPGRCLLWSAKMFDKINYGSTRLKFYSEDCLLFDDLYAFLLIWKFKNSGTLNAEYTSSSFIYLYNEFNSQSTSRTQDGRAHAPDNEVVQSWKAEFPGISDSWAVETLFPVDIPLIEAAYLDGKSDVSYKMEFSMSLLNRLMGEYKRKAAALLAELRPILTMLEL